MDVEPPVRMLHEERAQAEGNSNGEGAFPRAKLYFVQEPSGHKLDSCKWRDSCMGRGVNKSTKGSFSSSLG